MARQDARARATPGASRNSPHTRSVREERQLRTRRRLLEAALHVFEADGYYAASVEEIVSAAEVARATFYLHFKNKLAVLRFLTDEIRPSVADLYTDLDQRVVRGTGDIRSAIREWLEKALDWYSVAENQIIAAVWQELSVGVDSQVARGIAVDVYMPRYLDQWPPDGRDAARTRVILLSHLLSRAALLSQRGVRPAAESVVIESLADLWAAGLAPPTTESDRVRRLPGEPNVALGTYPVPNGALGTTTAYRSHSVTPRSHEETPETPP